MKKYILISALSVFVFTNIFCQDTSGDKKKSHAEFEETIYDFGTLEKDADASHIFEFKNTGKIELVVSNVKTSCGCTTPSYSKEPIKKGKIGTIKVKYDSRRIGNFNKSVTVYSNADNSPTILRIKGVIKQKEASQNNAAQ